MMSSNGQILLNLLQRQNLTVANVSDKCKGTITRHRTTVDREEKAVLDYLIFCDKIGPLFDTMTIDESRTYFLKKFVTTRGLDSKVESDHNVIVAKFCLKCQTKPPVIKREIFNFHNKDAQMEFAKFTEKTDKFSKCFDDSKPIEENADKFFKTLDDAFHRCFKKIRIKSKSSKEPSCEIQAELNNITQLKMNIDEAESILEVETAQAKLKQSEDNLTSLMSERNAAIVREQLSQLSAPDGSFNHGGLWKVKRKILPHPIDPLMAKKR